MRGFLCFAFVLISIPSLASGQDCPRRDGIQLNLSRDGGLILNGAGGGLRLNGQDGLILNIGPNGLIQVGRGRVDVDLPRPILQRRQLPREREERPGFFRRLGDRFRLRRR